MQSAYFWPAFVLTLFGTKFWFISSNSAQPPWVKFAIGVVPSILGFALGGMAIMLAFSTDRFLSAIKQGGKDNSYFMKVMASFYHLAVFLVLSLISILFMEPEMLPISVRRVISFIGFFASCYSVLLVLATVSTLWHTARIFNKIDVDSHRLNQPSSHTTDNDA